MGRRTEYALPACRFSLVAVFAFQREVRPSVFAVEFDHFVVAGLFLAPAHVVAGGEASHEQALVGRLIVRDFHVLRIPE